MPKAYFIKVNDDITWSDILKLTQYQINNSCKPLQYNFIAKIILQKDNFDNLQTCIAQPLEYLASYANESIVDSNGLWNCITIGCASDERSIIVYTAGRTIPLYVAIDIKNIPPIS